MLYSMRLLTWKHRKLIYSFFLTRWMSVKMRWLVLNRKEKCLICLRNVYKLMFVWENINLSWLEVQQVYLKFYFSTQGWANLNLHREADIEFQNSLRKGTNFYWKEGALNILFEYVVKKLELFALSIFFPFISSFSFLLICFKHFSVDTDFVYYIFNITRLNNTHIYTGHLGQLNVV